MDCGFYLLMRLANSSTRRTMRKFWAYIFVGANDTGKSTIQKYIAYNICGHPLHKPLRMNSQFPIRHPECPSHYEKLFLMNHSIQERMSTYGTVDKFFDSPRYFKAVDICVLSTHETQFCWADIERMIYRLRYECYNISGIFFQNCWTPESRHVATFDFDEVFWIGNEPISIPEDLGKQAQHIDAQLIREAAKLSDFMIRRAKLHASLKLI